MDKQTKNEKDQGLASKVGKYLTDLKELPVEIKEEVQKKTDFKPKVEEVKNVARPTPEPLPDTKKEEEVPITKDLEVKKDVETKTKEDDKTMQVDDNEELIEKAYTSKDVILGVINILSVTFLIFLLVKLPQKAAEIKSLRLDSVKYSESIGAATVSEDNVNKSKELADLFLDDFGVYNFTSEIEKLKISNPAIQRVSFTSQKAVQDKLKLNGVPVVIVMKGDWTSVRQAIRAVESLPYLFRPINLKSQVSLDDANVIILNYGGILYVGDKFTKN